MISKRKFYRRVFYVEVLSEFSIPEEMCLADINLNITEGPWSGKVECDGEEEVDGPTMAHYLEQQGSSPEFFQLNENGEDVNE